MKNIETILAEHEQIKRELIELRDQIEPSNTNRQNPEGDQSHGLSGRVSPVATMLELQEQENRESKDELDSDDDDGMSTASGDTMTWKSSSNPINLKKSHQQPNGLNSPTSSKGIDLTQVESIIEQNHLLSEKIESISINLDQSVQLGQTLMEQHESSSHVISELEKDIEELKKELSRQRSRQLDQEFQESLECSIERKIIERVEGQYLSWKDRLESVWKEEQSNWEKERSNLRQMIKELEERLTKQEAMDQPDRTLERGSPARNPSSTASTPHSSPSKSKRNRRKKPSQTGPISIDQLEPSSSTSSHGQNQSTVSAHQPSYSSSSSTPVHRQSEGSWVRQLSEAIGKPIESTQTSSPSTQPSDVSKSSHDKPDPQSSGHPNNSSSSDDRHHSTSRQQIDSLKYLSAAGGVALIGLVTYAIINHFKDLK